MSPRISPVGGASIKLLLALALSLPLAAILPERAYAEDVLVFGGTGRLGGETVRELRSAGYSVAVFARPDSSRSRLADLAVRYVEGDLLNGEQVAAAFSAIKPRIVIDASALYSNQHEIAMQHIIAGARPVGVARIIHHSSVGAGDNMALFPQIDFTRLEKALLDKGRAERLLIDSGIPDDHPCSAAIPHSCRLDHFGS